MAVTQIRSKQQLLITNDLSFQSAYKITNLVDPTNAQDAATKSYVDAVKQALDIKDSVRVATTANITLSGAQTIDGVAVVAGDRVLVKDQTTGSANGIYLVASGAWTRAVDANTSAKITAGLFVFVEEGTSNGDNGYVLTTNGSITLDTTALVFTQFSGAGQITAGAGLTKSGNTLDIGTASTSRIVVNADTIDLGQPSIGSTVAAGLRKFDYDVYGRISNASAATLSDISTAIGSQTANLIYASPSGSAGAPVFRALTSLDISTVAVTSLAGTTNQVSVSAATGAVTISLPQNIHTGAIPTFAGLIVTAGTVTTSTPYNSITQTWNAGAVTFTGELVNITDTASAAASKFVEYQVGGVARWAVRKDGAVTTGIWNGTAVGAVYGGTGQTSYVVGDLLYADTTTSLAKLASIATGNVLLSGGVGTAPSYGKVGLTTHVSGTLAIGNGGTGVTGTPTNGQLLIGNGSGYTLAAPTAGSGISITTGSGSLSFAVDTTIVVTRANYITREIPTGTIDGTNATFTLANTPVSGTEHVFVNGILNNVGAGNDYTISGVTITFLTGAIPQIGDVIRVTYLK